MYEPTIMQTKAFKVFCGRCTGEQSPIRYHALIDFRSGNLLSWLIYFGSCGLHATLIKAYSTDMNASHV